MATIPEIAQFAQLASALQPWLDLLQHPWNVDVEMNEFAAGV